MSSLRLAPAPPDRGPTGPRRRSVALWVVAALVLLSLAVGGAVAVINRSGSSSTPSSPSAVAPSPSTAAQQPAQTQPAPGQKAPGATQPAQPTVTKPPPLLADGSHDTYVRKVDVANNRITVDVIQVFKGKDAVKAAIEDGKPPSEAQYLQFWIRNQNPRLRTLQVAPDLPARRTNCDDRSTSGRGGVLADLAKDPRRSDPNWYYTIVVRHDVVQRITANPAFPAC